MQRNFWFSTRQPSTCKYAFRIHLDNRRGKN